MPPRKKSGKGKERKLKRKQEQVEAAALLAKIQAAYELGDHMSGLPAFRRFNRNGVDITVSFHRQSEVSQEELKWAFELMRENVKSFYISGGWGWNDKEKWSELTHDSACYLVARDSASQKPVGFINFRFDLEEGVEVVYCYEIHLNEEVRRKGLGKFLMQILELIGHRANMKKVMLTVFKENSASNHFFRDGMNYTDDETSPLFCDPLNDEEYSYSILSKALVKPVKPAGPASPVTSAEGESNGAQQVFVGASRGGGGGAGGEKKKLKLPAGETLLQGEPTART